MEHLHHFGLTQDPFSNEPDLRFYFESASHRDAQRRVERGLRQHKGLTLMTGDGGMGKTLLTRRILDALEEEVFEATLLVMLPGAADAAGILQRFARQLGCEEPASDRAGLLAQIYEQLAIVREDGRHAVLIVDDAQIMSPEVFAELSGLLNLEYEDRRLMSMLFVGSPELDRLVETDPSIMPRVDVRVRLQPLDMQNAAAYMQHRLAAVNGNPAIVPAPAMDALFKFGRGRPRLLNTLADNALFEAYLAGRDAIDPSDVERAAADLGIGADPGTTYSQLAVAPPPSAPTAAASALPGDPVAPVVAPPALDLDEPVADLDLDTPLEAASGVAVATLDLDEGLEAALDDDFSSADLAEPVAAAPGAAMDPSTSFAGESLTPPTADEGGLEFATPPPAMTDPGIATGQPVLEGDPVLESEQLLEAEPVLEDAEPLLEAMPLELGEADALDDAFVELIEE